MIDTQSVGFIGTFIGSAAVAAFASWRALKKSTAIQTELNGPGDEPSLRKLIKDQGDALGALSADIKKDFGAVHVELDGVSQRIEKLERAVFSTLEARLKIVEDFVFKHSTRKRKP